MLNGPGKVAGLILAGGRARRMGTTEKTLLDLGGAPIMARIIGAVAGDVAWLAISANGDPARFARFALPVLPDEAAWAGQGPLAGLCAGLAWAAGLGAEFLFTTPGDTPFVPSGLPAALAPAPAYVTSGGRDHPLAALWPVSCRDELRRMLAGSPSRGVAAFGRAIGSRRVVLAAVGADDPFLNVNTPEDLAAARRRIGRDPGGKASRGV